MLFFFLSYVVNSQILIKSTYVQLPPQLPHKIGKNCSDIVLRSNSVFKSYISKYGQIVLTSKQFILDTCKGIFKFNAIDKEINILNAMIITTT
jgi:hypothetical protein